MNIVTRAEFVTLLRTRCSEKLLRNLPRYDLDIILDAGECAVCDGDLSQSADWHLPTDNLLVLGSITCGGLVDMTPQSDDKWGGSLWVLGNLRCRNLAGHYGASVIIDADLTVAELAVGAFEDSMLLVTGDFTTHYFYGRDIWAEVGGHVAIEFGDGYALPLGWDYANPQAIYPRYNREASRARLNLDDHEGSDELVVRLRRGEHFRMADEA